MGRKGEGSGGAIQENLVEQHEDRSLHAHAPDDVEAYIYTSGQLAADVGPTPRDVGGIEEDWVQWGYPYCEHPEAEP